MEVSVTFLKIIEVENFMQKVMMEYFLDIPQEVAYKCLNTSTKKVVESANVNFDEFTKVHEIGLAKEPEQYKSFIYFYDGIPNKEDLVNQATNQQQISIPVESQTVKHQLHSRTKPQLGTKCYILKDDRSGKFDAKSDERIFLGYSTRSKAYKCLNTNTNKIVESVTVKVDEYFESNKEREAQEPENYKTFI